MKIQLVEEPALSTGLESEIAGLLALCFSDYPPRAYAKQRPHRRFVTASAGRLLGHLAIDCRAMSLAGEPISVVGIADLCVHPSARRQGIAGRLLDQAEQLARSANCDFMILFADDPRLYQAHGFCYRPNPCRWLKIHEHASLGVAEAALPEALMVKAVGAPDWRAGELDLLGFLF